MLEVLFIMFCITVVLVWYEAWKIGDDKSDGEVNK